VEEKNEDTNGIIISLNRRTDNTMATRKRKKRQTIIYTTLHIKPKDFTSTPSPKPTKTQRESDAPPR